jgi:hypothetical protein
VLVEACPLRALGVFGVHWRTDAEQGLLLGEAVAIRLVLDLRRQYNENFRGFTFTRFDGTKITV